MDFAKTTPIPKSIQITTSTETTTGNRKLF